MNTSKNILNKSTVLQKQETQNTYHRAITKQSLKCKVQWGYHMFTVFKTTIDVAHSSHFRTTTLI